MRILTIFLFLATTAYGADNNNDIDQSSSAQTDSTNQSKTDESNQAKNKDAEASTVAPQAEKLKARKLGEAFQNFQPSEEISADNAVPFPVDI